MIADGILQIPCPIEIFLGYFLTWNSSLDASRRVTSCTWWWHLNFRPKDRMFKFSRHKSFACSLCVRELANSSMFNKRDSQNSCEPALVDCLADRTTFISSPPLFIPLLMSKTCHLLPIPSVIHVASSKKLFLDWAVNVDSYVPKISHLDEIAKRNTKRKLGEVYISPDSEAGSLAHAMACSRIVDRVGKCGRYVSLSHPRYIYITQDLHISRAYTILLTIGGVTIHSSWVHAASFFCSILMPAQTVAHLKYKSFPTPARKAPMPTSNSTISFNADASFTLIRWF